MTEAGTERGKRGSPRALLFAVIVVIVSLAIMCYPKPRQRIPISTPTSPGEQEPRQRQRTLTEDGPPTASSSSADIYPALFVCHGAGPLPLLGDAGHAELVAAWKKHAQEMVTAHGPPTAIAVVSAHYNTHTAEVGANLLPGMDYDYGGFPPESYRLQYTAPGSPALAHRMVEALAAAGIFARANERRDFDHGVFVPLLAMFPAADIPVVPVSILTSDDPAAHVAMGEALRPFRREGVLLLGSGSTMHSFAHMRVPGAGARFGDALSRVLTNASLSTRERVAAMLRVSDMDGFAEAHPKRAQEHLMPLLTLLGAANGTAAREAASVRWMGAVNVRHYIFEH